MGRIVTLTMNPALDRSCEVEHVVQGRKLRCGPPKRDPGGGGINVARALHRLGCEVTALWTCGGPTGQRLGELLDQEGVPHRPLPVEGWTRENVIVFETASDRPYRFLMPGSELTEREAERCLEQLRDLEPAPDYLVASGSLPPGAGRDFYGRVVRQLPKSTRCVLDADPADARQALGQDVFMLKPNIRELGELVGREVGEDSEIRAAAGELVEEGMAQVVVTSLGAGGALVVTEGLAEHVRSPTVTIRSAIGAGDSMVAGIVCALAGAEPLPEAVQFGVAAGAAAVLTPGTELCRREDVEHLHRQMQRQSQ